MCGSRDTFASKGPQVVKWFAGGAPVKPNDVQWVSGTEFKRAFPNEARGFSYDFMRLVPVVDNRTYALGAIGSSVRPITRRVIFVDTDKPTKCGAMCRNAKGPICDCSCKGENHGAGVSMSRVRSRFAATTPKLHLDLDYVARIGEEYGQRAWKKGIRRLIDDNEARARHRLFQYGVDPMSNTSAKIAKAFDQGWLRGLTRQHMDEVENPPKFKVGDRVVHNIGTSQHTGSVVRVVAYAEPEPEYLVEFTTLPTATRRRNISESSLRKAINSRARFAAAHIDLKPTAEMASNAERGLALREKHGKGGTAVGVARARDIKNRANLSPSTVRRMNSFFSRHDGNQKGGEDDAGYIAWLLWGGDAGKAWAARKSAQLDKSESARLRFSTHDIRLPKGKRRLNSVYKVTEPSGAVVDMPAAKPTDFIYAKAKHMREGNRATMANESFRVQIGSGAVSAQEFMDYAKRFVPNVSRTDFLPDIIKKTNDALAKRGDATRCTLLVKGIDFSKAAFTNTQGDGAKKISPYIRNELAHALEMANMDGDHDTARELRAVLANPTIATLRAHPLVVNELRLKYEIAYDNGNRSAMRSLDTAMGGYRGPAGQMSRAGAKTAMKREYVLWALPEGETDRLHEKPIAHNITKPADMERIKSEATKRGYHSFRVQVIEWSRAGGKAGFAATVAAAAEYTKRLVKSLGFYPDKVKVDTARDLLRLEFHDAPIIASNCGSKLAYALTKAGQSGVPVEMDYGVESVNGENVGVVQVNLRDIAMKGLNHRTGGNVAFQGLDRIAKNAEISKRILDLVAQGKTAAEAVDAVLGAGTYRKLADEVYDELRRKSGMSRAGRKARMSYVIGMHGPYTPNPQGTHRLKKGDRVVHRWHTGWQKTGVIDRLVYDQYGNPQYVVYYDNDGGTNQLNESELTKMSRAGGKAGFDLRATVQQMKAKVAQLARTLGFKPDDVTGNDEMMHILFENQPKQAERLAAALRTNLARVGVPASAITTDEHHYADDNTTYGGVWIDLRALANASGKQMSRAGAKAINNKDNNMDAQKALMAAERALDAGNGKLARYWVDAAKAINAKEAFAHPSWHEGMLGKETAPQLAAYSWIDRNMDFLGNRTKMTLADLAAGVHSTSPSLSIDQAVLKAAKDMVQKGVATGDLRQWVAAGGRFSRAGAKAKMSRDGTYIDFNDNLCKVQQESNNIIKIRYPNSPQYATAISTAEFDAMVARGSMQRVGEYSRAGKKSSMGRSYPVTKTVTESAGGTWTTKTELYAGKKATIENFTKTGSSRIIGTVYQDPDNRSMYKAFTYPDGREIASGSRAACKAAVEKLAMSRAGAKAVTR